MNAAVPSEPRDIAPERHISQIPSGSLLARVLDVNYVHLRTGDGGELYLTTHGVPFLDHLKPENWYDADWFVPRRRRLQGTSTIYKIPTRPVDGRAIDLVVKYSRVGQDVPLETHIIHKVLDAEFNSPFEEFALVEELRLSEHGPPGTRILPMLPLAIYVPPERMQPWQTGRSEHKIASKIARHPGIEIDILRDYILVYAWIYGMDAVEAQEAGKLTEDQVRALTIRADEEIHAKGFRVLDMKAQHVIVFPENGGLRQEGDRVAYRLVDFELLQRTEEYDRAVKASRRHDYLVRQRDRFVPRDVPWPAHLSPAGILGVDYVFGHAESTGGLLWVVGKDPVLFDYFLPERWRKTPRIRLTEENQVFYTRSKDNIHLVWRVSRVGEIPDVPEAAGDADRIRRQGYNSPFEEFSCALRLRQAGIPAIYPRAIYMTGHRAPEESHAVDENRIRSHRHLLTPAGEPILRADHDYITVWGYWNGPDEMLAHKDGEYYKGVNARQACLYGLLDAGQVEALLDRQRRRLAAAGMEAPDLKSDHLIISVDPKGALVRDAAGDVEAYLCNFQLLRPAEGASGA